MKIATSQANGQMKATLRACSTTAISDYKGTGGGIEQ